MKIKKMLLSALSVLAISATALGVGTWKTTATANASTTTESYTYTDDFSTVNEAAWTIAVGSDGSTATIADGKMTLVNNTSAARQLATLNVPYKNYELTFTLSDSVVKAGGILMNNASYSMSPCIIVGNNKGINLGAYIATDGVIPEGQPANAIYQSTGNLLWNYSAAAASGGAWAHIPVKGGVKITVQNDICALYYWNEVNQVWAQCNNWPTTSYTLGSTSGNKIGFGFIGATGSYTVDDVTVTSLDAEDDTIVENDTLSYDMNSASDLAVTATAGKTVAAVTVAGKPIAATFAENVATVSAATLEALGTGEKELGVHLSDGSYDILTLNVTKSKSVTPFEDDFSTVNEAAWTIAVGSDGSTATIADGKMTLVNNTSATRQLATLNVPYKNYELTFTLSDSVVKAGGIIMNNASYSMSPCITVGNNLGIVLGGYIAADGVIPEGQPANAIYQSKGNLMYNYSTGAYQGFAWAHIPVKGGVKITVQNDICALYYWNEVNQVWAQCNNWPTDSYALGSTSGNKIGFGFIGATGSYTVDDVTVTSLDAEDDTIVENDTLSYDIATASDLAVTATAGKTVAAVTVAGKPIAATFAENVATVSAETLKALGVGEKELGVHLSDGSYDVLTLTVENNYMAKIEALDLVMQSGAAIRIGSYEYTGIRFTTSVDETAYNALMQIVGENKTFTEVSFGTVIVPVDYVGEYGFGDLTVENVFGENKTYAEFIDAPYEWTDKEKDGFGFFGGIKNLNPENIARGFVGLGYVKYTLADGTVGYQFAEFYNGDMANNTRSIYDVAVKAYADTATDAPTDNEKSFIKEQYIDRVAAFTVEYYTVENSVATKQETVIRYGVIGKEVFGALREYEGYTYNASYEGGKETATLVANEELVLKYYFIKDGE